MSNNRPQKYRCDFDNKPRQPRFFTTQRDTKEDSIHNHCREQAEPDDYPDRTGREPSNKLCGQTNVAFIVLRQRSSAVEVPANERPLFVILNILRMGRLVCCEEIHSI